MREAFEDTRMKVSVIIPTFNCAQLIAEAIDSVLAQTCADVEIIIVDDGSTDNTKEVISPYLKDKRIQYTFQQNKGLAAARNTGIHLATGEFLKFLDSDDFLYPQQIEMQINARNMVNCS